MGSFDTVKINEDSYQTKAFGKSLKEFTVGDEVTVFRAPVTEEEFFESFEGVLFTDKIESPVFQVECLDSYLNVKWITIFDNTIASVGSRDASLPAFDYYGRLLKNS